MMTEMNNKEATMKLSKSKLALAKVINENGGWVDVADCATQDKDGWVCSYEGKPTRCGDSWKDNGGCLYKYGFDSREKIPNWHQCVLSREEYYQAYPKADADGWIEWNGGECPVDGDSIVDVEFNFGAGRTVSGAAKGLSWRHEWKYSNIIKYRLHKPEVKPEFCESVMRSIPEPESIDGLCAKVTEENKHQHVDAKPTIEQLAQDYRDKLDLVNRKQLEAEDAKVVADCALAELERAGEAIGLLIGVARIDSTKAIKDWRDLMAGDEIICSEDGDWSCVLAGNVCVVIKIESTEYEGCMPILAEYGDARGRGGANLHSFAGHNNKAPSGAFFFIVFAQVAYVLDDDCPRQNHA